MGEPGRSSWFPRWRTLLRACHRDVGYLLVGLTFVYGLSGLAVNHIGEWNPNFRAEDSEHQLVGELPKDAQEAAVAILAQLQISDPLLDVYRGDDESLEITLERGAVYLAADGRTITVQIERPRLLLRVANWLHLNRGKEAWTYVADGYAVLLLGLALSGMFMLPGRKGLRGRGALLVSVGVAIPVLYVVLSGGP